jgi:hypothetical protein
MMRLSKRHSGAISLTLIVVVALGLLVSACGRQGAPVAPPSEDGKPYPRQYPAKT